MRTLIVGLAAAGTVALSALAPAYSQEQAKITLEELVDCLRRTAPQLVEGTPNNVRDFVRTTEGRVDFYTHAALEVGKRCEAQHRSKQAAIEPVKN
jgi:hypothetical protein